VAHPARSTGGENDAPCPPLTSHGASIMLHGSTGGETVAGEKDQNARISQSVGIMINPLIFTRTRITEAPPRRRTHTRARSHLLLEPRRPQLAVPAPGHLYVFYLCLMRHISV
jgi:hypothetical protein